MTLVNSYETKTIVIIVKNNSFLSPRHGKGGRRMVTCKEEVRLREEVGSEMDMHV